MDEIRPLPFDPSRDEVGRIFDVNGDWLLSTQDGEFRCAAAQTFNTETGDTQTVVLMEFEGRRNRSEERTTAHIVLDPQDAHQLAMTLLHSVKWLDAAKTLGN